MAIVLHLDDIMAERGVSVTKLVKEEGITRANMSNIKTDNVKAIRFSTLEAICDQPDCQPGDIIEFVRDDN